MWAGYSRLKLFFRLFCRRFWEFFGYAFCCPRDAPFILRPHEGLGTLNAWSKFQAVTLNGSRVLLICYFRGAWEDLARQKHKFLILKGLICPILIKIGTLLYGFIYMIIWRKLTFWILIWLQAPETLFFEGSVGAGNS